MILCTVFTMYVTVCVMGGAAHVQHAGGEEGAIGGAAGRNDGASDVEDEDGGSYDSKMRQVVKKKLGREEKTWEEELDEEGAKVALRT